MTIRVSTVGRVQDRGHAGRDLAQGALGVRPLGILLARLLELGDQLDVRDRHRRLVGQAPQDGRILLIERVASVAVDGDRAEDLAALEHGAAMTEWIRL